MLSQYNNQCKFGRYIFWESYTAMQIKAEELKHTFRLSQGSARQGLWYTARPALPDKQSIFDAIGGRHRTWTGHLSLSFISWSNKYS